MCEITYMTPAQLHGPTDEEVAKALEEARIINPCIYVEELEITKRGFLGLRNKTMKVYCTYVVQEPAHRPDTICYAQVIQACSMADRRRTLAWLYGFISGARHEMWRSNG